jgi:hypothetical protein
MPEPYYHHDLPTKYTNELFRFIQSSGIPIAEFELDRDKMPIAISRFNIGTTFVWWDEYDWPTVIIRHEKTKSDWVIAQIDNERFVNWWRFGARRREEDPFPCLRAYRKDEGGWDRIMKTAQSWTEKVQEAKKDLQDLWEDLSRTGNSWMMESLGKISRTRLSPAMSKLRSPYV